MPDKEAALVIGICSHGLSIIRALHAKGVTVFAIEKNLTTPGVKSKAISKLFLVKDYSDNELITTLINARKELRNWTKVVLFATNDNHVKFICSHYPTLEQYYRISWAQERSIIEKLLDKRNLEHFSQSAGLNYPKSITLTKPDEQPIELEKFRYPVILKPAKPLSSFKTQIAENALQVFSLSKQFCDDLPLVVQEFIEGDDTALFFCALTLHKGEVIQSLVGQKLDSFPPARGQTIVAHTAKNIDVEKLTKQFFQQFNLSGPVSLELKQAPDNTYWVIEPTVGRTDFWSELCIKAGFNQPYQEYLIALDKAVSPTINLKEIIWFDCSRAPLSYFKACWLTKSFSPTNKKAVFTYFDANDLYPFINASLALLKRVVLKR